jgi:sirohydrochlorin ferrochelatase
MRPARVKPAQLAVVLVAHGSRDPRAAAATRALTRAVAAARPDWEVRDSYLDHSLPRPAQVLTGFTHSSAVLVPLLLTNAYHGRVDVPGEVDAARTAGARLRVDIADVLGPVSPLLVDGLIRRLPSTDLDAVVLAAAGTRDAAARATVEEAAAAIGERLRVPSAVAYASAAPPTAGSAVAGLRAEGAARVGVAAYFLAPGFLYDGMVSSALSAGAVAVAEPLIDAPELVRLVESRVLAAVRRRSAAAAA